MSVKTGWCFLLSVLGCSAPAGRAAAAVREDNERCGGTPKPRGLVHRRPGCPCKLLGVDVKGG